MFPVHFHKIGTFVESGTATARNETVLTGNSPNSVGYTIMNPEKVRAIEPFNSDILAGSKNIPESTATLILIKY